MRLYIFYGVLEMRDAGYCRTGRNFFSTSTHPFRLEDHVEWCEEESQQWEYLRTKSQKEEHELD